MFVNRLHPYCKCMVNSGNQHIQTRTYADFLKNLPKVGGGVSRFKKKTIQIPIQPPSKTLNQQQSQSAKGNHPLSSQSKSDDKPNRFAQKFSHQNEGKKININVNKHNNKNIKSTGAPEQQESDKVDQYNKLREKLREKQKQQSPVKPNKTTIKKQTPKRRLIDEREKIKIQIPTFITVSNLSSILSVPLNEFLKKLEVLGFEGMSHNYILDKENASLIADEFGYDIVMNDDTGLDLFPSAVVETKLKPRAPVVTIMGHVDHGKTTILDNLRKSTIVDQEHGGITQHIGAFSVITPISKKKITFLDTPGHAAFLKMRERGAIITDIIILVVAADDSVMPQTIEAIKHAKKSGVPVIVAINKCDKHGINLDKVLSDLARYEIDIEDYGGETQTVRVSGKTGLNMDKLEEAVITLSEMSDFKAEFQDIPSEGWIIESEVVKGVGNVATVLVRRGTVKVGSFLVAGSTYCKVRGMRDEFGKTVKLAGPSTPVQIWGWKELPEAGDQILEAKNEKIAKKVIDNRINRSKQIQAGKDMEKINIKRQEEIKELKRLEKINELKLAGIDISELSKNENIEQNTCIDVKYIVKSDVFGSAEAIKESIDGLGNEEVRAVVVSHEAGLPTDSDIDTAKALDAKILCFNVKTPKQIQGKADQTGVSITEHNIIYRLIEEVTDELTSRLKPHIELKTIAGVDIKGVFTITGRNKSKTKVAGCKVSNGVIKRSSKIRVLRKEETIYTGTLSSLKHVKDDITEAKKGSECGLSFENWDKFEEGDKVEVYEEVVHPRYL